MTTPLSEDVAKVGQSADELLSQAERRLLEDGGRLTQDELLALQALPNESLGELADLAHRVRLKFCGEEVEVESIISGKTGGCPEDCHFCSQSANFETDVAPTGLLKPDQLRRAAIETQEIGATDFCIVYAVRGPNRQMMDHVLECVDLIHQETNLQVNCSLGILTREQAFELAQNGVRRYNHNLETSKSYFHNVCTTHTWEDRRDTCLLVREAGMDLCSGGIIGLGEDRQQRIEFAVQLAELDPYEVPMNFLNPRPGTPLADNQVLDAEEAIRTIALFRLAMPTAVIRYGGGREITLGDLQAMGLKAGINALITGNYLTTLGQTFDQDKAMLAEISMPVKAVSEVL